MSDDKKQKINCTVESCQYNDNNEEECTLNEIMVAPTADNDTTKPDESMCSSYENNMENEENN